MRARPFLSDGGEPAVTTGESSPPLSGFAAPVSCGGGTKLPGGPGGGFWVGCGKPGWSGAVTVMPSPPMTLGPVGAAALGQVMTWVFSWQTSQKTVVVPKLGGMAGGVQWSLSPVHISRSV